MKCSSSTRVCIWIQDGKTRIMRWCVGCAMVLTLVLGHSVAAQIPKSAEAAPGTDRCTSVIPEMPHADALRKVCEYALALPRRLPNVTCEQVTARYLGDQPSDVVTAIVTYENGKETYREIRSNGKPVADASVLDSATWSTGQFGGDVQSLFQTNNKVTFEFANERQIDDRRVLTFQYRVPSQQIPVWRLHAKGQLLAPPIHGQLRIDADDGTLLRLVMAASEIPRSYPMRTADVDIKYDKVAFSDGTSFVLPVESVVNGLDRKGRQNRNELQFRNCHKFRATSHVVPQ